MFHCLVILNFVTPIPVIFQYKLKFDAWLYVYDSVHGHYTVFILNLFVLINLHCTTAGHGYRDIRLSLSFQRARFGHSKFLGESPFHLWVRINLWKFVTVFYFLLRFLIICIFVPSSRFTKRFCGLIASIKRSQKSPHNTYAVTSPSKT